MLTCPVVLLGGRDTANRYHWHVWGVLAVSWPHWVCPHSQHVCFPSLHWSGSRLLFREQALGCVHFPGLSCSGLGSWILHKGADVVGPAFCALPWSKQLRRPGAWWAHSSKVASVSYHLPCPSSSDLWVAVGVPAVHPLCLQCAVCLFWVADLWLQPSWWLSILQNPRKSCLETGSLFTVW